MSNDYIKSYTPRKVDRPLRVVFVRHGQPDEETRLPDRLGPPLTKLGIKQAKRAAKRLAGEMFQHIYSSDLERALQTAEEIKKYHDDVDYTVSHDIREVSNHHFLPGPDALDPDTRASVYAEKDSLTRFTNKLRHTHESGDNILVVCHGNLIRTLMPMFGGRDPRESILIDVSHSAVSVIEVYSTGEAILKLANCTRHLLPSQVT